VLKLKHIAAYFLLLVYGVSFGHQILPHHHHDIDEAHNHHHIGIHDHCVAEKETHVHVAQENHFDEGIMDYLACILSNHKHNPTTECELIVGVNDQKNTSSKTNKIGDSCSNQPVEKTIGLHQTKLVNSLPHGNRINTIVFQKGKRGPPAC
jgi:hypothetical protein